MEIPQPFRMNVNELIGQLSAICPRFQRTLHYRSKAYSDTILKDNRMHTMDRGGAEYSISQTFQDPTWFETE